jgi:glycosyltransferase involved in cell wall biosynthesis
VAALAPSGAAAVERAVKREIRWDIEDGTTAQAIREMVGTTTVEFVPHIVERRGVGAWADVGLELLRKWSVAEVDSILTKAPLIHRGQERTLEAGHEISLFGQERKDDFVILLQGGNYEVEDRKGWDTSIQAFVRFYNALEDASRVHLLIHSIESYTSSMDRFNDMDPPAAVLPRGLNLRLALHEWGIPSHAYTIDIARHAPEVVAAYKKRADVCLHPSKVEGFGMNVIECQAGE